MPTIENFDEFNHNGYYVTADLGSARFHFDEGVVTIQGHAYGFHDDIDEIDSDEKRMIEVILKPEDTADFNVSASAGDGELAGDDFEFEAELISVEDVEIGESL